MEEVTIEVTLSADQYARLQALSEMSNLPPEAIVRDCFYRYEYAIKRDLVYLEKCDEQVREVFRSVS